MTPERILLEKLKSIDSKICYINDKLPELNEIEMFSNEGTNELMPLAVPGEFGKLYIDIDTGETFIANHTGLAPYYIPTGNSTATIIKTKVVNKTSPSVTLSKSMYQACLISGAQGQRLSVRLAKADSDANSAGTIGIASETISINQEGFITSVGLIEDINTTGSLQGETWSDGDVLYLSPTVFGGVTNIKPIAPNHLVVIGYVEYAHANHGKIYVKIDNGYELSELHDVAYPTTPANNEIIAYTSVNSRWENKTIAQALGYNPLRLIQVTPVVLLSANWVLSGGIYEYNYSNVNILSTSVVDVIPENSSIAIVKIAEILPKTLSSNGFVTLYSTNLPTSNIFVTLNILN